MTRAGGEARIASLPALVLMSLLCATTQAGAETRASLRLLPAYYSGDFGTGISTDITYLPLIFGMTTKRHDLRVTVPFVSIRTEEPVTFAGGEVIRRGPGGAGSTSEAGPGDVVVQEEYFFVQGTVRRPWVSGIFRVKLPTADESRGLGTGEVDYGPGLGIVLPAGRRWTLVGALQYLVRGDPPGADFRNTLWITAGAQARISDSGSVNLFYDDRQSILRGRENIRDLTLGYDRRLSPAVTFRSAAYVGLSDTAEDYGFSAGFSVRSGPRP